MRPRLRDGAKRKKGPYVLGKIPPQYIFQIAKKIVFIFATGKSDITGEEWGDIFAYGIGGEHLNSPLGLADVTKEGFAWSVKSIKNNKPHECKSVRVISGRNSPDYSYGIKDVHKDIQRTGDAVLGIWNERIDIALDNHDGLRTALLIRNINTLDFTLFEEENKKYDIKQFEWKKNAQGNLEGYNIITGKHQFTWQPHGSQFTIKYDVPINAIKFNIKRPYLIDFDKVIEEMGFNNTWVTFK